MGTVKGGGSVLLTVAEARDQLQIGETFICDQIAKGRLPVVRLGRAIRIRQSDLDNWVEGHVEGGDG